MKGKTYIEKLCTFEEMITLRLVKMLYVLGVVTIIVAAILLLFQQKLGLAWIILIAGNIVWRIICESTIILFKLNEGIWELVNNSQLKTKEEGIK